MAAGDLPAATEILGRRYRLDGWVVNNRVDLNPQLLLPPAGPYHVQIDDEATVVTIRPDRTVRGHDQPDGPISVGLVRAA